MNIQKEEKSYSVIVRLPLFRHYSVTVEASSELDAIYKTGSIVRRFDLDDDVWSCAHELDYFGGVEPAFVVERKPGDPSGHKHDD